MRVIPHADIDWAAVASTCVIEGTAVVAGLFLLFSWTVLPLHALWRVATKANWHELGALHLRARPKRARATDGEAKPVRLMPPLFSLRGLTGHAFRGGRHRELAKSGRGPNLPYWERR